MPLPRPKKDEKKEDFITRCMSDETMKKEYDDNDQRLAVCYSQWEKKEEKAMNKFYEIRGKGEEEGEILLYGDIGESFFGEGMGAKQFSDDLKALGKIKNLSIRINSGGGSIFDGIAIFNAIDRHSSQKTVYIDGLAASAASVIAMAGQSIVMAENGILMIHNPFGGALGDANDMRKMAESLDKVKVGMILSYKRKTPLSEEEISRLMNEETWMTAKEALEKGFVTEIGKKIEVTASVKFDLSHYKNIPKTLSNLLGHAQGAPSDGPEATIIKEAKDALLQEQEELFNNIDMIYDDLWR